jgi:hypothetical protein
MRDWTFSRRHMLKASTALVGAAFAQPLKAQTPERGFVTRSLIDAARALWRRRVTETYRDYVDLHELTRQWPDGRDLPPLLADLTRYLRDQEQLSLGDFILRGDRMDDYWIENGVDCWPHFGFFMRLPDGSRVGQWFRQGESSDNIPIVCIDSEGEARLEASSLEEFLAVWALAQFDKRGNLVANGQRVSLPFDLLHKADSGAPDGRGDFLDFLRQRLGRDPRTIIRPHPPHELIERFFKEWGETQRRQLANDPTLRAIARILDAYIPRGKELWERVSLDIRVAGARCEVDAPRGPKQPIVEVRDIIPLVLEARAARAAGIHAVRGLWHCASILLMPDGQCRIAADWAREPVFRDGARPSADEIAADLARFPRSSRWMEPWMDKARR